MPRGVPKSASNASSIGATSVAYPKAPPPTRSASARSAKVRANASILEHDTDIDALIRKHDKKGARGFAPTRTRKTTTQSGGAKRQNDEEFDDVPALQEADEQDENRDLRSGKRTKVDAMTRKGKRQDDGEEQEVEKPKPKSTKTRSRAAAAAAAKPGRKAANTKEDVDEQTKKSPSPQPQPQRAVLVESRAAQSRGEHKSTRAIESDDKQEGPSSRTPPAKKLTKEVRKVLVSPGKRTAKIVAPSSSPKKRRGLPEIQIASFLENYDLEAENRLRMAQKTLQISIDSARTQMHAKAIARLPRSVRLMRLGDFIDDYGADVQAAIERAAVNANKARQGDWEEEKLQRKRKGSADEEKDLASVSGTDLVNTSKKGRIEEEEKTGAATAKRVGKNGKRLASRKITKPTEIRSPEPPTSPQASSVRPPTSATFTPQLDRQFESATPATGRPRNARTGEQVQWTSLNGSPIIGVIAPDGTIHAMPRTVRKTPLSSSVKAKSGTNWHSVDEEEEASSDAETSATQLLRLANGIDGVQRTGRRSGEVFVKTTKNKQPATAATSVNASPVSRTSLHTAQASRRGTMDALDSDDGGSVFEEARSRPSELDDNSFVRNVDDSLPDEEAYMAQIMREEAEKRARMLASEPRLARSSSSSRAPFNGSRSSGSSAGGPGSRASHSTIRANNSASTMTNGSKKLHPSHSSSSNRELPSSPMVRNKSGGSSNRLYSSSVVAAPSSSSSSSPSKGRVSVMLESGTQHMLSGFSVDDLMRLPSHERNQMIAILEKLKRTQA